MVWEVIMGIILDGPNVRCLQTKKEEEVLYSQLKVLTYSFGKSTEQKLKRIVVYMITEKC